MKRWLGAWLLVVLSCVPILVYRATSPSILRDTDTEVLLRTIRHRGAPLSWFLGDWPLLNHFYRPVSTLFFELDNRLYGNNAAGYGLTNALMCVACVLLLFWFLRELTDKPLFAAGGAVLFACQHTGLQAFALTPLSLIVWATGLAGLIRHGLKLRLWLPAVLVTMYCSVEVGGLYEFGSRTVAWLPGRTALVMTMFALIAMAAYTRYERQGADRVSVAPKSEDLPATRTSRAAAKVRVAGPFWMGLSFCAAALAFGAYEQTVMLPAVMLAVAMTMRLTGIRVRWGWQAGYWLLLGLYLVARKELLPPGVSGYQLQQFRHGPGVYIDLCNYALPFYSGLSGLWEQLQSGLLILMMPLPYLFLLSAASALTAAYQARRHWVFALAGYGMSFLAFLPMAWVHPFGHYHYWPMALRSILTMSLLWVAFDLIVIAWSPPTKQAPARLDPAPGSLPHR